MEPQMNTDKGKFFFTAEDAEVAEFKSLDQTFFFLCVLSDLRGKWISTFCFCPARQQEHHRHADRHAIRHLIEDH
jgi:hypothetical protein